MYFQKNESPLNLPIRKQAQTGHPTTSKLAEQFISSTPSDANMKLSVS